MLLINLIEIFFSTVASFECWKRCFYEKLVHQVFGAKRTIKISFGCY
jgi:hypothetical protein